MSKERGPLEFVVAAWPDASAAGEAMCELKQAKKEHLVGVVDVATLVVDDEGRLRITDVGDMGAGKGAVLGGLLAAGLGLLTGGVGWLLLGGGALGALAAKACDGGLPDERLKSIGERMTPNSSAIVAVIEHKWVAELQREVVAAGADVVTQAIGDDVAEQLGTGAAVTYRAAEVDGDIVATRTPAPAQVDLTSAETTTAGNT